MFNNDDREERTRIFQDTMSLCKSSKILAETVKNSISKEKIYKESIEIEVQGEDAKNAEITVTKERTLQCAQRFHKENPQFKIAVHNFASATNPGGGVTRGSSAQEEALCRCSTLYPCLDYWLMKRDFYTFHKQRNDLRYTDTCIFTPDVMVVKSDVAFPQRLNENEWFKVDVITCAAPNLREKPYNRMNPGSAKSIRVSDMELLEIHKKRARKILSVAVENHEDIVILGAFGCGAFQNSPMVVAKAYNEIVAEFKNCFEKICFAVYCPPKDSKNYDTFSRFIKTNS